MPECKNPLQEELKAYLDNELPALRRGAVARHLEQCPHCKKELAALQQLTQTLASLPAPEPLSPALRARILAQLPQSAVSVAPVRPFWCRPGPLAGGGSILALACALLLWVRTPAPETASASLRTQTLSTSTKAISPPVAVAVPTESKAAQPMAPPAPPAKKQRESVERAAQTDNFQAVIPEARLTDSPKDAAQVKVDSAPLQPPPSASAPMDMKAEVTAKKKVLSATIATGRGVPGGTFGARGGGGGAMGGGGLDGATFATGRMIQTSTPLTLTVAAGKAEETMTELRRLAKEQGATEPEPDPKQAPLPRQLVFTLAADKAAAFRATLEKQGKVSEPSAAFVTKKDTSAPSDPQTFVITIAEENPSDS